MKVLFKVVQKNPFSNPQLVFRFVMNEGELGLYKGTGSQQPEGRKELNWSSRRWYGGGGRAPCASFFF